MEDDRTRGETKDDEGKLLPGMSPEVSDDGTDRKARRARRQVAGAILVAAISVAGAVGSILGQGVAYRQMRAIEAIAQRCGAAR